MPRMLTTLCLAAALLAPLTAQAVQVHKGDKTSLDVGARLQAVGYAERLDDGVRDDNRLYLYVRQARLMLRGQYDDLTLRLETAFGGEEEVRAPSPGVSLGLLEASADLPLLGNLRMRAGQLRVPYGRERLANPGSLAFIDRSVQNMAFNVGRDVGAALYGNFGGVTATAGVFTGGGRSVPQRFLPQTLGTPMLVARVGYSHGLDEDAFDLRQQDAPVDRPAFAIHVNALWQKDSLIGHSSVFNVKQSDRPLLLNGNWNPFVATKPTGSPSVDRGTLMQVGGDIALRMPLGGWALAAEAEFNMGTFDNVLGSVSASGGRAQIGLQSGDLELAARYATVLASDDFAIAGEKLLGDKAIHEITPALTYHLSPYAKVMADLPVTLNAPTVREKGLGVYSLTVMPDQAALLRPKAPATPGDPPGAPSGELVRQTVLTGRLMLQVAF